MDGWMDVSSGQRHLINTEYQSVTGPINKHQQRLPAVLALITCSGRDKVDPGHSTMTYNWLLNSAAVWEPIMHHNEKPITVLLCNVTPVVPWWCCHEPCDQLILYSWIPESHTVGPIDSYWLWTLQLVALALVISSLLVLWCMKPGHYQSDLWFYMFNRWWCSLFLIPAVKKTVSWHALDHCLGMWWPLNGLFTCKNDWKYVFTDV